MFYVGQKVVCVDASGWTEFITKDATYTITSIKGAFLRINCKPADKSGWGDEESRRGYNNWRFRPIVERRTDISIFIAMLTPATKEKSDG